MYSQSLRKWREGESYVPALRNFSLHHPKQGLFKLTRFENEDFESIAPEKWPLIKEALLLTDSLELHFGNEPDLQFISSVVKESDRLRKITLYVDEEDIDRLIYGWKRSGLDQAEIDRRTAETNNNIEIRQANITEFMVLLQHSKTIRKINIVYSSDFKAGLCYVLQNPHLESIALHSIPEEIWRNSLVSILSNRPLLKTIKVSGVVSGDDCSRYSEPFCQILETNPTLEKLYVSIVEEQTLPKNDMKRILSALESRLINSSSTTSDVVEDPVAKIDYVKPRLILSCHLPTDTLSVLTSPNLKHLDLSSCNIDDMSSFARGLSHCTIQSLKLTLYYNAYDTFVELVNGLVSSGIEKLDLSCSNITDEMCLPEVLGKLITETYSLKILILSHNKIGNDGFASILTALSDSNYASYILEELQLHGNCYDDNALFWSIQHAGDVPTRNLKRLTFDCSYLYSELVTYYNLEWALVGHLGMYDGCECRSMPFDKEQKGDVFGKLLKENKRFKSEVQYKIAIISHTIARGSRNAVFILPKELWIRILSEVKYTNMEFNKLVESIFNLYKQ